jgi:hypothetical protein
LALLVLAAPHHARAEDVPDLPDPLPIQRILMPPERVPAELDRVRSGVLRQLSREAFEARVQRAARAGDALKNAPRLVEARYRAALVDGALAGTGQWKIINPTPTGTVFVVQPLSLAFQKTRWQKAQFGTTEAIWTPVPGRASGLLVEHAGEQAVLLDWTARSDNRPDGLHFDLRVPACALATLELDLPADRLVVPATDRYLVSGPHPAESVDHRLWRIDFAGRSRVDVVIRPILGPSQPRPLVLAHLRTTQDLGPDLVRAEFELTLETTQPGPRELVLECDAALRPYEVAFRTLETWEAQPAPPGGPTRLLIRLREPFQGGSLVVRCLVPLANDKKWSAASVRLVGALPRGETLILRLAPEIQLEDWHSGSFRFTRNTVEAGVGQLLTLTRINLGTVGEPQRPSARLRLQGPEIKVGQLSWWRIGPDASTLTTQLSFEVIRGRLFRLGFSLPAGWQAEEVQLTPPQLLRSWRVNREAGTSRVFVDLQSALKPPPSSVGELAVAQAKVRLRPEQWAKDAFVGKPLVFPTLRPLEGTLQESTLAINVDPHYQADVAASAAPIPLAVKGPWGRQTPNYTFSSRGQPLEGTIVCRPRPARLRARCTTEVVLALGKAAVVSRLLLQPDVGSPETIDLLMSAAASGPWNWRTKRGQNAVRQIERLRVREIGPRLLPLTGPGPWQVLGSAAAQPAVGEYYRLTFAQPLREPLLVESTLDLPSQPPEDHRWQVPLPVVVGSESMDGQVTLHLAGTELVAIEPMGLRAALADASAGISAPWQTFRYTQGPIGLRLHGRVASADRSADALADDARLTTYVETEGRLVHHFRFRAWSWKLRTFPVRLPPGAHPVAAKADGRWLARVQSRDPGRGPVVVEFPVTEGGPAHEFEIVYATEAAAWSLWTFLEPPPGQPSADGSTRPSTWQPELPIRLVSFRHDWRLPPGIGPLLESKYRRLPGGLPPQWTSAPLEGIGPLVASLFSTSTGEDGAEKQRRLLRHLKSTLRLPSPRGEDWRLGELLNAVAADSVGDKEGLVVDAEALGEGGWGPASQLPSAPRLKEVDEIGSGALVIETSGIVFLPCRTAILVTTRKPLAAWRTGFGRKTTIAAVQDEVEAAAQGRDPSGRFQNLFDWLQAQEQEASWLGVPRPPAILHDERTGDWTVWEPYATEDQEEGFVAIRQDLGPGLGGVFAGLLLLAGWRWRRAHPMVRFATLLACLSSAVLALAWLPRPFQGYLAWPTFAVAGVALVWFVRGLLVVRRPAPSRAAIAAGLAFATCTGLAVHAANLDSWTVFLVAGPGDAPAPQTVLTSPELLDQLDTLAFRGVPTFRLPFLIGARYDGTLAGTTVDFRAEFPIYCLTDEPAVLTLPLGGVQLQEALLDGAAAQPQAARPPAEGYLLAIKGRGAHTLVLRFSASVAAAGNDRSIRLAIPELVQSRMTLEAPAGATYLRGVGAQGAQRVMPAPKGLRLEADLGRLNVLDIRWHLDGDTSKTAAVTVREAYLWDLHAAAASLFGVLQYTISPGAVTTLALDLPDDTEVRSVEVVRMLGVRADEPGPRLQNWSLAGTGRQRRLQCEFQHPVSGSLQVLLELIPRSPLGPTAEIQLPIPLGARPAEGTSKTPFIAYRLNDLRAQLDKSHRGITAVDQKLFADFWRSAGMGDPGPATHAYGFHRLPGSPPLVRLNLQVPTQKVDGSLSLTWEIGHRQAELLAVARLAAHDQDLVLVEWHVPEAVAVVEVSGTDVRTWSRCGDRVQVWLQPSVANTTLRLIGWASLDKAGQKVARANQASAAHTFRLPPIRLELGRLLTTTIHASAAAGLSLEPVQLANLATLADGKAAPRELRYVAQAMDFAATFKIRPALTDVEAHTLTVVEASGPTLSFQTKVDYALQGGELRTVTIRVRNWDGEDIRIDAPGEIRRQENRRDPDGRTWTLVLRPGITGQYRLHVSGKAPVKSAADMLVPDVSVVGVARSRRWVAIAGRELRGEDARGLALLAKPDKCLPAWPAEAERIRQGGTLWEIRDPVWQLSLQPHDPSVGAVPVQIFLADYAAALVDGRRWCHQATFCLYRNAARDLTVLFPAPAQVLSVAVDEAALTPLQPEPDRLWLPLAGPVGAQTVRIRWFYDTASESLLRPDLDLVRLAGVADAPAIWTVQLPPGFGIRPVDEDTRSSAAQHDLRRASAQLQLCAALAEHARAATPDNFHRQIRELQERFYRQCQFAERQSEGARVSAVSLREIRERNHRLAETFAFETTRVAAEKQAFSYAASAADAGASATPIGPRPVGQPAGRFSSLPGLTTYWVAGKMPAPHLILESPRGQQIRQAWVVSGLLLATIVLVTGLALFLRMTVWYRAFWPELMILAGCSGVAFSSVSWPFVGVVVLGVGARLLWVARWLGHFTRGAPPAGPSSAISS